MLSGGSGGSRKAGEGHGEALAWVPGLAGSAIGGRLLETPPLGAPGPVFQSVEKYCKKSLQGGAGSRPAGWGADGEERKGPF